MVEDMRLRGDIQVKYAAQKLFALSEEIAAEEKRAKGRPWCCQLWPALQQVWLPVASHLSQPSGCSGTGGFQFSSFW